MIQFVIVGLLALLFIPSSALAIASIRKAARRFGSCRACRRSASDVSSSRIVNAAPIAFPSRVGTEAADAGEPATPRPESQFIRSPVLHVEASQILSPQA